MIQLPAVDIPRGKTPWYLDEQNRTIGSYPHVEKSECHFCNKDYTQLPNDVRFCEDHRKIFIHLQHNGFLRGKPDRQGYIELCRAAQKSVARGHDVRILDPEFNERALAK